MIWFIIILLSLLLVLYIFMYNRLYKAYKDKEQRYNAAMVCLTDLTNILNDHLDSNLTIAENDYEIKVIGKIKYLVKD